MLPQRDIDARAMRAKEDEKTFRALVEEHRRFILGCASRTLHRYVHESDDAWSVALIAFYEAVRAYAPEQGGFLPFAKLVIRRRLTDKLASEYRRQGEILVAGETLESNAEDGEVSALTVEVQRKVAEQSANSDPANTPMRDEIEALGQELAAYGFTFFDLAEASPKAQKTRQKCALAICTLLEDPALIRKMRESRQLPAKEIMKKSGTPRKILENHRKYIIAGVEILYGEYPLLAEYLRPVREMGTEKQGEKE